MKLEFDPEEPKGVVSSWRATRQNKMLTFPWLRSQARLQSTVLDQDP
jgi:hypothetical protein